MHKLILILTILLASTVAFGQDIVARAPAPDTMANGELVYYSVQQMPAPSFNIQRYLRKNLVYPAQAKKEKASGRVILKLIIDKTGKVTDVQMLRDIGGGCGDEAVRVVKAMPDWKPGMQNGQPVNVYYTLPVSFDD